MRTTINIEKARELGLPIPEGASAMILYEILPVTELGTPLEDTTALRGYLELPPGESVLAGVRRHLAKDTAHWNRRLKEIQAQLDSEQALRKGLEKELEDALAKLTEPPAKPKPAEPPADQPADKPKKRANG
jgi:hypothetical protein